MSSGSFRAIRFGGMRHGTFNLKWVVNDGNMHYKKKKKQILDGLKPFRNAEKPSGINSRRFFLDGLKPSRI
jgi:hypothetical protein